MAEPAIMAGSCRCIGITPRDLIAKIPASLVMLPHFFHIGGTRLDTIGSGESPRLAVVSGISDKEPDLGLERA
jgi:hypothetical protein